MKTTNFKAALLVILMAITLPASSSTITSDPKSGDPTTKMTDERGDQLIQRLNEIKDMDKSDLSRSDKKELRNEVKSIKKELKDSGRGIYLSVGAIIIVILLLILLV